MESVLVERSGGLDVHKETVVGCVMLVRPGERKPYKELRTFSTFTHGLRELAAWLHSHGVTHVGMESTGTYWKPVYAILEEEGGFEIIVGNAHHMKNVPGRKTDVKDAEWIARLVQMGLVRKSFVPPRDLRDLRDLVRYRRSIIQSRTSERNRLQKVLETANIKLGSVASDVFGASGMAMLRKIVEGETDPEQLAQLARTRLRQRLDDLRRALEGRLRDHHRLMLRLQLKRLDEHDQQLAKLDAEIDRRLASYREEMALLCEIPGIQRTVAATVIAEMGVDMSIFPTPGHLAAWAGVCPGNYESAGKSRGAKARRGNIHLRTILVEAAHAARLTKGTYLRDKFHRLKARRGYRRAAIAIAHRILVAAYHVLKSRQHYRDLGAAYLDRIDEHRVRSNLVRRLERLGYNVTVEKPVAPPPDAG